MLNIKDRIEKIKEYFLNMDVNGTIIDIVVKFPSTWFIVDGIDTKYDILINSAKDIEESPFSCEENTYYFASSFESGFDSIFDAIDENIKIMQLAEERAKIFDEKKKELSNLFDDEKNSVEMLKTLPFSFEKKDKKTEKIKGNNNDKTCQQD